MSFLRAGLPGQALLTRLPGQAVGCAAAEEGGKGDVGGGAGEVRGRACETKGRVNGWSQQLPSPH